MFEWGPLPTGGFAPVGLELQATFDHRCVDYDVCMQWAADTRARGLTRLVDDSVCWGGGGLCLGDRCPPTIQPSFFCKTGDRSNSNPRHHHRLGSTVSPSEVDTRWRRLVQGLAGIFCASVNFLDEAVTTAPVHSLRPSVAFVFFFFRGRGEALFPTL